MSIKYELEYQLFENQPKEANPKTKIPIWFGFHGIGQNTDAFKYFAIQNNLKLYSIGLFYHQKKEAENKAENKIKVEEVNVKKDPHLATSLENWLILVQSFLETENITLESHSIHVIAFSLGARPALQFVYHFSTFLSCVSIAQLILVAPETLAISNWYRFATQTVLGKFLLKKIITSPFLKKTILYCSSFLFSKKAQKLIHYQLYHGISSLVLAWLAYRSFEMKGKEWKEIEEKHKGKITIVASEKDNFVRLSKLQKFIKKNSPFQNPKKENENVKETKKEVSINWCISNSAHAVLLKEFKL